MKKIFAIALALVMVLSMASAFAANNCSTFDWTCTASVGNCGKGKVEVVPYVMVNDACGDFAYEVSTCASAINSQLVYYAVKLTVEANPDMEWWKSAKLEITSKGMTGWTDETITGLDTKVFGAAYKKTVDQVWYVDDNGTWKNASDKNFDIKDFVRPAKVAMATKAKVCATLSSYDDGYGVWTIGDYTVEVATNSDITVTEGTGACASVLTLQVKDGKVYKVEGTKAFADEVAAALNLPACILGTCVDDTIIERNFGWDDEFESCFSWSDKGASVVNPECVVTLPKTGDASLLWWLF